MPFTNYAFAKRFSDLVFKEEDPADGYARESVNITPPTTYTTVDMGTVFFRAKSTDPYAAYARLSASSQLVDTNEFVVVFGDRLSFNPAFVPLAIQTGEFNAVGFKRGMVQLKEYYIKQIAQSATNVGGAALTDAQFESLRELLKRQGIIVEVTR